MHIVQQRCGSSDFRQEMHTACAACCSCFMSSLLVVQCRVVRRCALVCIRRRQARAGAELVQHSQAALMAVLSCKVRCCILVSILRTQARAGTEIVQPSMSVRANFAPSSQPHFRSLVSFCERAPTYTYTHCRISRTENICRSGESHSQTTRWGLFGAVLAHLADFRLEPRNIRDSVA